MNQSSVNFYAQSPAVCRLRGLLRAEAVIMRCWLVAPVAHFRGAGYGELVE
jgi:hypothetical protein